MEFYIDVKSDFEVILVSLLWSLSLIASLSLCCWFEPTNCLFSYLIVDGTSRNLLLLLPLIVRLSGKVAYLNSPKGYSFTQSSFSPELRDIVEGFSSSPAPIE